MIRRTLLALMLAAATVHTSAAQFVNRGDYQIHYTTLSSMLIPAEVAAAHNITRAKNRIIINISALKSEQPISTEISGYVTNLLEQRLTLSFEEVRESDAIYYLANHIALENDILKFKLLVTPPGAEPVTIEFLRRYD